MYLSRAAVVLRIRGLLLSSVSDLPENAATFQVVARRIQAPSALKQITTFGSWCTVYVSEICGSIPRCTPAVRRRSNRAHEAGCLLAQQGFEPRLERV